MEITHSFVGGYDIDPTQPNRCQVCDKPYDAHEWSGSQDPEDPDNFWIDDVTGERVSAHTGERSKR